MSMSVEQVRDLQKSWFGHSDTTSEPSKESTEPEVKDKVPSTETETKGTASKDNVDLKDVDKRDVSPKSDKTPGSDEPVDEKDKAGKTTKVAETEHEPSEKKEKRTHREERDFAFLRLKNKTKAQIAERDKRIAELEKALKERDGLEERHFVKPDGTIDTPSYVQSEFEKRDLKSEIDRIKNQNNAELQKLLEEEDEIITQRCFGEGDEYREYKNLLSDRGNIFETELDKADPNGVVKSYLGTLNEYPVVLRRLMTDLPLLSRLFRSHDPDALKYNIRVISDEILDEFHKGRQQNTQSVVQQNQPQVVPQQEKKEMPVIGRQINSSSNSSGANQSLLRDWDTIDRVIKEKRKW